MSLIDIIKSNPAHVARCYRNSYRQLRRHMWQMICAHAEPISWADYKLLEEDVIDEDN